MAALIDPLASGLAGCAGGTVTIYQRGTTTPATVYTSWEETGGTTGSSGVHNLDANGAAVLYTVEPITLTCKNAAGDTVRTVTFQGHAGNVEVKQTGYNSAASTNAKEVLADLYTSLGAADANVSLNGEAQTITGAVNQIAAVRFNVKSYGAAGNAIADDLAAIQNAVNAGVATGGAFEVYFPDGTYNVSDAITVSGNCTLRGSSRSLASIRVTDDTKSAVSLSGTLTVSGLTIARRFGAGAVSGHIISVTGTSSITLISADLDASGGTVASSGHCVSSASQVSVYTTASSLAVAGTGHVLSAGAAQLTLVATARSTLSVSLSGSSGKLALSTSTSCSITVLDSALSSSASTSASDLIDVAGGTVRISQSTIDNFQGSGTSYMVKANGSLHVIYLTGNTFTSSSGTVYVLRLDTSAGATRTIFEANNRYFGPIFCEAAGRSGTGATISTPGLDALTAYYEPGSTTQTLSANPGRHILRHTSGASMTITSASTVRWTGRRMQITYTNNTGGAITPAFAAEFAVGTIPSVANGSTITVDFCWSPSGKWQQVSGNPVATA